MNSYFATGQSVQITPPRNAPASPIIFLGKTENNTVSHTSKVPHEAHVTPATILNHVEQNALPRETVLPGAIPSQATEVQVSGIIQTYSPAIPSFSPERDETPLIAPAAESNNSTRPITYEHPNAMSDNVPNSAHVSDIPNPSLTEAYRPDADTSFDKEMARIFAPTFSTAYVPFKEEGKEDDLPNDFAPSNSPFISPYEPTNHRDTADLDNFTAPSAFDTITKEEAEATFAVQEPINFDTPKFASQNVDIKEYDY